MPLSVDELRAKVKQHRSNGLNTQQIADELSLSQTTIQWLSTEEYSSNTSSDDRPTDVQVGWRSVAVKASRIEAISYIFADIIEEEIVENTEKHQIKKKQSNLMIISKLKNMQRK